MAIWKSGQSYKEGWPEMCVMSLVSILMALTATEDCFATDVDQ